MKGVALSLLLFLASGSAYGLELPYREKTTLSSVMIAVYPRVEPGAQTWLFVVTYGSFKHRLADRSPARLALRDGQGRSVLPLEREASQTDHYHRQERVVFPALQPWPRTIRLEVALPGERAISFQWRLPEEPE